MFLFLKYLLPSDYFLLKRKTKGYIFPNLDSIPESVIQQLESETRYKTDIARDYDLSWQVIKKGFLDDVPTYTERKSIALHDEYVFVRRYFNKAWVLYTLLMRLITFNNPFKELTAFFRTASVKRSDTLDEPLIVQPKNDKAENSFINNSPKISVIIPTLNRYSYLKDVLEGFEKQDYINFEVIVVDQSEPFQSNFYDTFNLDITVIYQKEKALWLARNTAIKQSKADIIALSEDDVRIQSNWLSAHLECLSKYNADISAGVFYPLGKTIPKNRSYFTIASQFATGNAMLYKSVFKEVGLFDRQFEKQRMGDGEFGLRCFLKGFKNVSNPLASCVDVKASTGGLREMGSWDAFRTSSWFAPRPIPSVLYFFRSYFGNIAARYALLKYVPQSIMPYQFKQNKALTIVGVFVSLLLAPLIGYQVVKSWNLASKKLKEGPMIDELGT